MPVRASGPHHEGGDHRAQGAAEENHHQEEGDVMIRGIDVVRKALAREDYDKTVASLIVVLAAEIDEALERVRRGEE